MADVALGWWGVPLALIGGAIRVSTPFLFVSLGECVTEKSGRINLGLEGTLVLGAMSGYAVSYMTGSPWAGVFMAGVIGALFGLLHAFICSLPRVNDIAVGIALMLLGIGLAFYFGKAFIQPVAPPLPSIPLGWWSAVPQVQAALKVNILFLIGIALAPVLVWALRNTRWAWWCGWWATAPTPRAPWATRSTACAPPRPCSAGSSAASAARSCRSITRAAGAKACRAAKASPRWRWSSSRAGAR